MESNNAYKSFHILSEAVIMGGISMYFYKKISELESTIDTLKGQINMQNNQIKYLLESRHHQTQGTLLKIPTSAVQHTPIVAAATSRQSLNFDATYQQAISFKDNGHAQSNMNCENGVCQLVSKLNQNKSEPQEKKVVISKISKQIEFDEENSELDHTLKVNTFTDYSPNPVLKSVTPRPSESMGDSCTELEKILNDIDDE